MPRIMHIDTPFKLRHCTLNWTVNCINGFCIASQLCCKHIGIVAITWIDSLHWSYSFRQLCLSECKKEIRMDPLLRETWDCAWILSFAFYAQGPVTCHATMFYSTSDLRIWRLTKRCSSFFSPELILAAGKASEELHLPQTGTPPFPQDLVLQIRIVGRFLKFLSILGPVTWSCLTTVLDSVLRGTRAAIRVAPGLRRTAQSRRQIVFCFRSILKSLAA